MDERCSAAVDRDVTGLGSHRTVKTVVSVLRVLRVAGSPSIFTSKNNLLVLVLVLVIVLVIVFLAPRLSLV